MKRFLIAVLLCALVLCCALPALAADKLAFAEKTITIFEGDSITPELIRDGKYADDVQISFSTNRPKVISVDEDGTVTGLAKGEATLTCNVTASDGRKQKCTLTVKVARRVQEVSLNTKNLRIYLPDDPILLDLIAQDPVDSEAEEPQEQYPVLVIPVNKPYELYATVLPSDASSKAVVFETSDLFVAEVQRNNILKGLTTGECELIVSSKQNPEVTQVLRLVVVQPITKLTITAESKTISVGADMQLDVNYEPYNATLQQVTWSSDNEKFVTVDEYGIVTGIKRGAANIKATAADGSGKSATFRVNVEQGPESVTASSEYVTVNVGATQKLTATVLPSNVNNKNVTWTSSDDRVATVAKNGSVKGISVGTCTLTCSCDADPGVYTTVEVTVQQPVQKITFNPSTVSVEVNTSAYLTWDVMPMNATNPAVTFKSSNEKIAVVDQNGCVTGIKKGTCKITATAADGSKKTGTVTVKVTQPVAGVYFRQDLYHLPYREYMTVHAYTEPKDADNQAMSWYTTDGSIAAATTQHSTSNYTRLYGNQVGTTMLNVTTDDGGYAATSVVVVDHYNDPVKINDLYIGNNNNIRITLWNKTNMCLTRVFFQIELFGRNGLPLHCAADGTNRITGYYIDPLDPGMVTEHGRFHFDNFVTPQQPIGGMILKITGYRTNDRYTIDGVSKEYSLNIAEEKQPEYRYPLGFEPTKLLGEDENEAPAGN